MNVELRMARHRLPDGFGQRRGIGVGRICEEVGYVVDGRCGIFQTLQINPRLCIRQRHVSRGRSLGRQGRRGCRRGFHQGFEYFILYELQCAGLDELAGVDGSAVALVDEYGQSDG